MFHWIFMDFLYEWADHNPHEAFFILLRLLSLIICVHVNRAIVLNVSLTGVWEKLHAVSKAATVGVFLFFFHCRPHLISVNQMQNALLDISGNTAAGVEFQIVALPQQDTQRWCHATRFASCDGKT